MKIIALLAAIASASAFAPNAAFSRGPTSLAATMTTEQFNTLKSIISDQLDVAVEKVTKEASFTDDLDADSLDVVEMVMAIEETFGIEIEDEAASSIKTVGDVCNYLEVTLK
jgi:acyl carrier protein